MRRILVIASSLCLLHASAQKTSRSNATALLLRDLGELKSWFGGEFNNFQQVYKEREDSARYPHEHIHSVFYPVTIPAIGDNLYYVYQYMDGDERKVYRQRLYRFTPDPAEQAIRLDIFSFKADSLYYLAHRDPAKLSRLTPADLSTTPGCAVYWKKQPDHFVGYMKEKACQVVSQRSGKRIIITDSLRLTPDEIWIRDEAEDEDGNYVFGHREKIPHKLKRCRYYTAWWALQKAGLDNQWHAQRNLRLHDQGGRIPLVLEDGQPTKYEIELATVLYSSGLEVLKLALYEKGSSRAVHYSWASPLSRNIGFNLRWIQAGLTLASTDK